MQAWRSDQVVDALLAAVLATIAVASALTPDPSVAYDVGEPNAALVTLTLLASVPLAVRRRWPLIVSLVVVTASVTIGALGWNAGLVPFLIMLALYTVADGRDLRAAAIGLGHAYAGFALLLALRAPFFDSPLALVFVAAATGAWAAGRWARRRRAERERAVAAAVEAERVRAVEAERAVLAERLHVAREMHDVVSHTLSVIAVQAGTARHRLERGDGGEGGAAVPALQAIETASRAALEDLRRMLGLLRAEHRMPEKAVAPPMAYPRNDRTLLDGVVAVAIAALGIGLAFVHHPGVAVPYPAPDARLVALILLGCLPLAVRRRWPVPVLVAALTATVAVTLLGWNAEWPGLASYVALYTVAAWRRLPVAVGGFVLVAAAESILWRHDPWADLAGALVPLILGFVVRRWRSQRDAALARALETSRTTAAAAERAVFAERLRIAGELHDVVTHTLSAVAVQAAVARHRLDGTAGIAAGALSIVEDASRSAMDDLRRMLGILRDDSDLERASLSPTPGIAELEVLASAHRAAHGPVELTVDPAVGAVPGSVQLTAFRLVQEALTNVRKHAPGAPARVRVGVEGDWVLVDVENDGLPAAATTGGFGLQGMRERVALFGGTLDAGPHDGGGFRVRARLGMAAA